MKAPGINLDIWNARYAEDYLSDFCDDDIAGFWIDDGYSGSASALIGPTMALEWVAVHWTWGSCSCCCPIEGMGEDIDWDKVRASEQKTFKTVREALAYLREAAF